MKWNAVEDLAFNPPFFFDMLHADAVTVENR
jgi:hypothetical protein